MYHTGDAAASQLPLKANEAITVVDRASEEWVSFCNGRLLRMFSPGPSAAPYDLHNTRELALQRPKPLIHPSSSPLTRPPDDASPSGGYVTRRVPKASCPPVTSPPPPGLLGLNQLLMAKSLLPGELALPACLVSILTHATVPRNVCSGGGN